ncbi:hypothetical protein ACOME3_009906 [Neoechinorhynchus agilis]
MNNRRNGMDCKSVCTRGASLLCGMNDQQTATARYDYEGQDVNELSITRGDRFVLVDDSKLWWLVRNLETDEVGYVPSNFMRRDRKNIFAKFIYGRRQKSTTSQQQEFRTDDFPLDNQSFQCKPSTSRFQAPCYAVVQHRYNAQKDDELTLTRGTRVTVLQKKDDGWWLVEACAHRGWFPSNHLSEHVSAVSTPPAPLRSSKAKVNDDITAEMFREYPRKAVISEDEHGNVRKSLNAQQRFMFVRPILPYEAQNDIELNVAKGERLKLLERSPAITDTLCLSRSLQCTVTTRSSSPRLNNCSHPDESYSIKSNVDWLWVENEFGQRGFIPRSITLLDCSMDPICERTSGFTKGTNCGLSNMSMRRIECWHTIPRKKESRKGRTRSSSSSSIASCNSSLLDHYASLTKNDWYFGLISRQTADELLTRYGQTGDFLIRESMRRNTLDPSSPLSINQQQHSPRFYSISVLAHNGRVRHFRVDQLTMGCFTIGKRVFGSLNDLVR